jgi:hypothetical protein
MAKGLQNLLSRAPTVFRVDSGEDPSKVSLQLKGVQQVISIQLHRIASNSTALFQGLQKGKWACCSALSLGAMHLLFQPRYHTPTPSPPTRRVGSHKALLSPHILNLLLSIRKTNIDPSSLHISYTNPSAILHIASLVRSNRIAKPQT